MPYVGLPSFLQMTVLETMKQNTSVNALCRATFISTATNDVHMARPEDVSMPYVGLPSFLHIEGWASYDDTC